MTIIGHGIDLVEVRRIVRLIDAHGDRFLSRCFTEKERGYCGSIARTAECLAARFAAKEAVLKALGTGLRDGISWKDMEILRQPSGEPMISLKGRCAELAARRGIDGWRLSLSHTRTHAIASAIATGRASGTIPGSAV